MKPTIIEHKSQNEIIAERREKREQMISGVVGSRREPLLLKYPELYTLDDVLERMSNNYKRGYENGYEIGESKGKSDGTVNGIIIGVIISVIVFIWISSLFK